MADSQPPHTDSRPSSPPVPSEATPLLPSTTEQSEARNNADNDPTRNPPEAREDPNEPSQPPRPSRTIILLTTFSLSFALSSLVFIGVAMLIVGLNPKRTYVNWTVQECLVPISAFVSSPDSSRSTSSSSKVQISPLTQCSGCPRSPCLPLQPGRPSQTLASLTSRRELGHRPGGRSVLDRMGGFWA